MITPQQLAQIAQLLQTILHPQASSSPTPLARPAMPPLAHGTVGSGRALLPTRSRPSGSSSSDGRATAPERETRSLPRMESQPTSASSAYMSMSKPIPAPTKKKMTWPGMVRPGAGNFGMG